jgi:hypothetical protein
MSAYDHAVFLAALVYLLLFLEWALNQRDRRR